MENTKLEQFEQLVKPLQEWLHENYDPHTTVIVDNVRAELVRGEMATVNNEIKNRG